MCSKREENGLRMKTSYRLFKLKDNIHLNDYGEYIHNPTLNEFTFYEQAAGLYPFAYDISLEESLGYLRMYSGAFSSNGNSYSADFNLKFFRPHKVKSNYLVIQNNSHLMAKWFPNKCILFILRRRS